MAPYRDQLFGKPAQLTLFRQRVFSGEALMSLDKGIENGLADATSSPWQFAPTTEEELEWPKWGQFYETKGGAGEAPDLPSAVKLRDLYNQWLATASPAAQRDIWQQMLQIWANEVYSIGTVGGVLQPVVVNSKLRNVPEKGIYNWDPGAFFGVYKPDQFWFDTGTPAKSTSHESKSTEENR